MGSLASFFLYGSKKFNLFVPHYDVESHVGSWLVESHLHLIWYYTSDLHHPCGRITHLYDLVSYSGSFHQGSWSERISWFDSLVVHITIGRGGADLVESVRLAGVGPTTEPINIGCECCLDHLFLLCPDAVSSRMQLFTTTYPI